MRRLLVLLILGFAFLQSCDDGNDVEYVTEEELVEEGLIEYVDPEEITPESEEYVPPPFDPDTVPEQQDEEPDALTVEDLRNNVLTDGKLDTDKVVGSIIHALKYMTEINVSPGFVCTDMAYLATPILLPMNKGEQFTHMYVARKWNKKKYHFILLNFKGVISGKNYSLECTKELMNYKEIFVFLPENEDKSKKTQTGILLAISDEYLKDLDNMVNINWQIGATDDDNQYFGTIQVYLRKDVSGYTP